MIQADFTRATELTPEVEAAIDDAFEYHKWDAEQIEVGMCIRNALARAVKALVQYVPPCPDRTVAIRKLREARMEIRDAFIRSAARDLQFFAPPLPAVTR